MIIANMQVTAWKPWTPRLAAFGVALLLSASLVFWVLRWPTQAQRTLALPIPAQELPAAPAEVVARLLGGVPTAASAEPDVASRFRLTGIIAAGAGGQGVALLSIDGQPAKPYRVGSLLEEGWMLQSVQARSAALGPDAKAAVRLQLELQPRQ